MSTWDAGQNYIYIYAYLGGGTTNTRKSVLSCIPSCPATEVGVSALSHFRQPHLNQEIMECWPCLNIGRLSSLIPATAKNPDAPGCLTVRWPCLEQFRVGIAFRVIGPGPPFRNLKGERYQGCDSTTVMTLRAKKPQMPDGGKGIAAKKKRKIGIRNETLQNLA